MKKEFTSEQESLLKGLNSNNKELQNIDFSKFQLNGKKCIIEVPTEEQRGMLIFLNDKEQLKSGWFKLLKTGSQVTDWKEGQEVFIWINHPPIFLNELVFQDKDSQEEILNKHEQEVKQEKSKIIEFEQPELIGIDLKKKEDKVFKREFAVIQEYDILFAR